MKVGDYVTVQAIMNQSECRWVVLTDLIPGKYNGTAGGIVHFIGDNDEAGDVTAKLTLGGTEALLICGALEPLCVGGVFVE